MYETETVYGLPVAQFGTCSPTNHRMAGPLVCYFIVYKMFSATEPTPTLFKVMNGEEDNTEPLKDFRLLPQSSFCFSFR